MSNIQTECKRIFNNALGDTFNFISNTDKSFANSMLNGEDLSTNRTLWCVKCQEDNPSRMTVLFGCTGQHLFDVYSIAYFTWGIVFRYFIFNEPWFPLFVLSFCKLGRNSSIIESRIYRRDLYQRYGNIRMNQSILSMYGDILSVLLGFYFVGVSSNWITFIVVVVLNSFSSSYGGDIFSSLSWYLDYFGWEESRKRYLPPSNLEKIQKDFRKLTYRDSPMNLGKVPPPLTRTQKIQPLQIRPVKYPQPLKISLLPFTLSKKAK